MTFSDEPTLYLAGAAAIVDAVFVLLLTFGVPLDADQKGAISALVTVVVTVVAGWLIRSRVTPVAVRPKLPRS